MSNDEASYKELYKRSMREMEILRSSVRRDIAKDFTAALLANPNTNIEGDEDWILARSITLADKLLSMPTLEYMAEIKALKEHLRTGLELVEDCREDGGEFETTWDSLATKWRTTTKSLLGEDV